MKKPTTFEESCREFSCNGFRGYDHCKICNLSGPTKCTEQANCLNVSLEAELKSRAVVGDEDRGYEDDDIIDPDDK